MTRSKHNGLRRASVLDPAPLRYEDGGMTTVPEQVRLPAEWLAHRYDPGHDAIHFISVDRDRRRRAAFLTDAELPDLGDPLITRRDDLAPALPDQRVNFVFHSAYCCSTLVANAYDRPGRAFSLKEPVLLNDLVGWRHRGGAPAQIRTVLQDGLATLARPFEPGEVCVIKPSNVVNGLAMAMLADRPDAAALLLYAPLEAYLGSIAGKGLWGRLWVRDLLAKFMKEGLVDLGFAPEDIFLQSDLQVAATGWLAQHAVFAKLVERWPMRVRTLESEVLLARPMEALTAVDTLFGVNATAAEREAVVQAVFTRHAKSGGDFDAEARKADQRAAAQNYAEELAMVVAWADKVAHSAGIALIAPNPLLST